MIYFYLKAFHIIFFTSWFAGLFYLPRIYVNLAMAEEQSTYDHLLKMARKLYRFVTPLMVLAILPGIGMLYLNDGFLTMIWLQIKLALVALLVGYHFLCGYYLKQLSLSRPKQSHVYFRFFNEFPVLVLIAVVLLAVVKPL